MITTSGVMDLTAATATGSINAAVENTSIEVGSQPFDLDEEDRMCKVSGPFSHPLLDPFECF